MKPIRRSTEMEKYLHRGKQAKNIIVYSGQCPEKDSINTSYLVRIFAKDLPQMWWLSLASSVNACH